MYVDSFTSGDSDEEEEEEEDVFDGEHFLNDPDKMYDFLTHNKTEFLKAYAYLREEAYDHTLKLLKEDLAGILSYLTREAENIYQENINDRDTECLIKGEQYKEAIFDYAKENLTAKEYEKYTEYCNSMGC